MDTALTLSLYRILFIVWILLILFTIILIIREHWFKQEQHTNVTLKRNVCMLLLCQ